MNNEERLFPSPCLYFSVQIQFWFKMISVISGKTASQAAIPSRRWRVRLPDDRDQRRDRRRRS
jgi:hypothetical protein